MAYVIGQDQKRKKDQMDLIGNPGSFENIKSQMQQSQLQSPVQPQHAAPVQQQKTENEKVRLKKPKKRYEYGGVVQKFQEGGFVDEEEDEVDAPAGPTPGAPSGQSSTISGPSVGRGASAAPQQQRSGSFTGIQKYIEANKPKIQQLSQDISSGIGQEAGGLRGQATQARQEYLGPQGKYAGGEDFIKQQIAGAGQSNQTAEQADRFKSLREAQDGPSFQQEGLAAKKLEGRSAALGKAGGRFSELQRMVGKQAPSYTGGQRRLDQALLGGDPASRTKMIREARQATQGLSGQLGQTAADIESRRTGLQTALQSQLGEASSQAERARAIRQERLGGLDVGSTISDDDLSAIGLTRDQVSNLYGVDPSDFIGSGGASPQELARINALARMGGKGPSGLQAYDPTSLLDAVGQARGRYQAEEAPLLAKSQATHKKQIGGLTDQVNVADRNLAKMEHKLKVSNDRSVRRSLKRKIAQATADRDALNQQISDVQAGGADTSAIDALKKRYQFGQGLTSNQIGVGSARSAGPVRRKLR